MSIPINQDTSTQPTLTFTTVSTPEILNIWQKSSTNVFYTDIGNVGIGTTTNINFKLKVNGTVNATAFNGDGANITSVPYSTITGKPTNFQSDWTSTIINKPTNFQSDWNSTVINKPSTFSADMTNIYTKTETNNLLSAKEATLTFTSPLTRTTNTISFSESAITTLTNFYNKTDADARYLQLSGGTLTGNLNVNANITTQQLYINNQNSTASIIFSPNPSIYSIFSRKVPWAMYFAEDFNPASATVLPNYISNSRDATLAGTITKTTTTGPANGATGNITYISGGTGATISFPTGSIPSTFTILGLMRYTNASGNQGRILTSSSGNWLLGYNTPSEGTGIAFFNGWRTAANLAVLTNKTDWLCMIAKNVGATPNNIIANGTGVGNATGGDGGGSYRLAINNDMYGSITTSDWALSCVMIWDTALTDAEMLDLNTIINTYKNDGVSIKSLISSTIDDDSIIESRVYNGLEKTELLLFKGNDGTGTNGVDRIRLKAGNIAFDTYSSLTPSSSRNNENIVMLINENGNVGIGTTTNLTSKLNINGSLNATSLSGDGANITNVPYSTITGKPSTFPADMTNIYTKVETDNLLTNKDAILSFSSPLVRSTNTITFNESSITTLTNFYNKNDADNRYLKLSGGSLTGNVYGNDILLSVNKGSFKRIDTLSTANVNVPGVGEEGPLTGGEKILLGPGTPTTHPYSIGLNTNVQWYSVPTGATQIFYVGGTAITTISSTGLTTTGVINASTNLQENGTNLTSKYLQLSGGTMTGAITGATEITTNKLNCVDSGIPTALNERNLNIIGTAATLRVWRNHATNNPAIELIAGPTTSTTSHVCYWDMYIGASAANNFFAIRDRKNSEAIRLYINNSGNVGIGTNNPGIYKLNVNGSLNSTSLYNDGTLINFSSYATNTDLTTNYYNKITTDNLLSAKDAVLTFTSPLVRTTNTISFNESSITTLTNFYNKTNSDDRYLRLSGGTLSGALTINGSLTIQDGQAINFGSGGSDGKIYRSGGQVYIEADDYIYFKSTFANNTIDFNQGSISLPGTLVASTQVRSPLLTATQNSRAYTSGIYGTAFNGWYIDLNTFWSGNAGNGGTAYLTLSFCFSQNTSIKWFGRVMVNSAGGAFYIITDLKIPTSGLTMIDITNEWGTSGQNFLYISQAVMNNTYTLIYKIIG